MLKNLKKPKKSPGPDGIINEKLKYLPQDVIQQTVKLLNLLYYLQTKNLPADLTIGKVIMMLNIINTWKITTSLFKKLFNYLSTWQVLDRWANLAVTIFKKTLLLWNWILAMNENRIPKKCLQAIRQNICNRKASQIDRYCWGNHLKHILQKLELEHIFKHQIALLRKETLKTHRLQD